MQVASTQTNQYKSNLHNFLKRSIFKHSLQKVSVLGLNYTAWFTLQKIFGIARVNLARVPKMNWTNIVSTTHLPTKICSAKCFARVRSLCGMRSSRAKISDEDGTMYVIMRFLVSRLSNHPDFVGITPILIENPESRPTFDRHKKNLDFDIRSDIFVKLS